MEQNTRQYFFKKILFLCIGMLFIKTARSIQTPAAINGRPSQPLVTHSPTVNPTPLNNPAANLKPNDPTKPHLNEGFSKAFTTLNRLVETFKNSVKPENQTDEFKDRLALAQWRLKEAGHLLASINETDRSLLMPPLLQFEKILATALKLAPRLHADEVDHLHTILKTFTETLGSIPFTNETVGKELTELVKLSVRLSPSYMFPTKTITQYAQGRLEKIKKQINEKIEYAKTHEKEAAMQAALGMKALIIAYLTWRITLANKGQDIGHEIRTARRAVLGDIATVKKTAQEWSQGTFSPKNEMLNFLGLRTKEIGSKVQWKDVVGQENAKKTLEPIISNINEQRYDLCTKRGILFYGDPGLGKTFLAKAFATRVEGNFYATSGTDMQNDRNRAWEFHQAASNASPGNPSIIFIDEIIPNASGKVPEQTRKFLGSLLETLDGAGQDENHPVFVIAATNYDPFQTGEDNPFNQIVGLHRRFTFIKFTPLNAEQKTDLLIKELEKLKEKYSFKTPENIETLLAKEAENNKTKDISPSYLKDVAAALASKAIATEEKTITEAMISEAFEEIISSLKERS